MEFTGMGAEEFLSLLPDYAGREREEPAILIDGKKKLLVLKRDAEEVCCFYSGEGCSIHPARPSLCRAYPFVLKGGKFCEIGARACAGKWEPEGEGLAQYKRDAEEYARNLEKYREIADAWNQGGGGSFGEFLEFAVGKAKKI